MNTGKLAMWILAPLALSGVAQAQSMEAHSTEPASAVVQGAPFFDDTTGPDSAPEGTRFGYLRIAGSSFAPRDATKPANYSSAGCITASANGSIYSADIQLPNDADVRYVRTYYYNNAVASGINTFFTDYDANGAYTEHTTFLTPPNRTGYGDTLSPQLAVTINTAAKSYAMIVNIGAANPNLRFCGVRIQYFY